MVMFYQLIDHLAGDHSECLSSSECRAANWIPTFAFSSEVPQHVEVCTVHSWCLFLRFQLYITASRNSSYHHDHTLWTWVPPRHWNEHVDQWSLESASNDLFAKNSSVHSIVKFVFLKYFNSHHYDIIHWLSGSRWLSRIPLELGFPRDLDGRQWIE